MFDERDHKLDSTKFDSQTSPAVTLTRRKMLTIFLAGSPLGLAARATNAYWTDTYSLESRFEAPALRHVQVVIETQGKLKLNPDGKEVAKLPIQVRANLKYLEQVLANPAPDKMAAVLRKYDLAHADLKLGDKEFPVDLPPDKRTVRGVPRGDQVFLYAPGAHLTREELDLLSLPGDTSLLHCLLPSEAAPIGTTWRPGETVLAGFLGLDSVVKSDVATKLKSVDKSLALLELQGTVSGAVGGVSTDLEVQAKLNFDLDRHLVTWLAMYVKEDRSIGHAVPGYETETRVRVAVVPTDDAGPLADIKLPADPTELELGAGLLSFASERGGFEFLHDRDWRVMADRHDVTILRLIQQGDLLAQCNISKLPPPDKGLPSLPQFQAEVQNSLAKNLETIVEAKEGRTSNGLRVLRVLATGMVSELPIEWIYYHLDDGGKRRAALVFTLEAKLAERFGGLDQSLVEAFRFRALPEPTPAREARTDSKAAGSKVQR